MARSDTQKKTHLPRTTHTRKSYYTRKDFQSNDGMLTSVWGPSMWHYLHTMSFNYPVKPTCDDKTNYRNFVLNLKYVLPCGKCRMNLCKNFKKLPLKMSHMKSRESFSRYMYNLHELINGMLDKKSGLSYADVRERYEHFRARCADNKKNPTGAVSTSEIGCTEPFYGEKTKCVLHIVPQKKKCESFKIDMK
jgi:hypothetical protein